MEVEGWLARAAASRPHITAIETPTGSWSYEQLHLAARFAAGELSARGATAGSRAAQGVTRFVFKQPTTGREFFGIVLVVIGVALLVWAY